MSSSPEPSILEYARFHDVAINSIPNPLLLAPPEIEDIDLSLCDISNHPSIDLEDIHREIQTKTREKLDANWASAPLLSSIIKLSIDERPTGNHYHYEEIDCSTDSRRIRDMKLEAPVLQTDHERDMRAFRRGISLDYVQIDVALEYLDDENDESLKFPSSFWSQGKRLWRTAQGERLSCMKDSLLLMQGIKSEVVASADGHVDDWLNDGIIFCGKVSRPDDVGNLEPRAGGSNKPSPNFEDPTSSPNVQKRILDLKVEPPITPPVSTKKRPAEDDENILKYMARTGIVPEITSQDAMEIESVDLVEDDLAEVVNAAKRKAEDELNAERIRGISTMTRCKVPLLRPPIIIPPWPGVAGLSESELKGLYRSFISEIKTEALAGLRYSIGAADRKNDLKWQPFEMEVRTLEISENMTPEDSSSGLLREIGRHISGSKIEHETPQVVCHNEFRLSSLDDDEELSPRTVYGEVGSVPPLQRKGCEHGAGKDEGKGVSWGYSPPDKKQGIKNIVANPKATNLGAKVKSAEATLVGSGMSSMFSPLDSLSNFMESDRHPKISTQIPERATESNVTTISLPLLAPPSTTRPQGVLTFVLSTSLLRTHRAVIYNLESLSPACNLIFRDDNTLPNLYPAGTRAESFHQTRLIRIQKFPNSPENNQGREADISFSPTAGAILTTTQEITQKYLPGQQPSGQGIAQELNYPVRRRISDICLLYEELYVFICIPIITPNKSSSIVPHADMELDNRAVQAIESLRTFCESLGYFSRINVLPVMNGASNITNWLVSLANKHYTMTPWSTSDVAHELIRPGNVPFPADPSPSEDFLRQSGLNTFAAQMVLLHHYKDGDDDGVLHSSGGHPTRGAQSPQAALSRFVCMNPFDRQRIFTPILGKRVVERVERRLAVEEG
ncbi:hypothetical protein RJ035_000451 [Blastomyces gilchristii]